MDKYTPAMPCAYHGVYKSRHGYKGGQRQRSEGEAPKSAEPIWSIVSGLAHALNEARDQLSTLLQARGSSPMKSAPAKNHSSRHPATPPTRYHPTNSSVGRSERNCVNTHGGVTLTRNSTPRCYSAPHSRDRGPPHRGEESAHNNVHRSHARGHCAFGRNTEFREKMHHSRGGGFGHRMAAPYGPTSKGRAGGGGGGGDEGRPFGIKLQGGMGACGIKVTPNGKSYSCKTDRGKAGIHMLARMRDCNMNVDTNGEKFGPHDPVKFHFTSPSKVRPPTPFRQVPEVKRYCVGTQYANLLRQEAHHLREQRIIQENKTLRRDWKQP